MRIRQTRHVRRSPALLTAAVVLVGCSATQPDDVQLETGTRVSVCVGTSAAHRTGGTARLQVRSRGDVLAAAEFAVPGQVVLTIPSSAPEPRLLVDGKEWASSPRGGGWVVTQGDGCPTG